jgi:hypothetical protein
MKAVVTPAYSDTQSVIRVSSAAFDIQPIYAVSAAVSARCSFRLDLGRVRPLTIAISQHEVWAGA